MRGGPNKLPRMWMRVWLLLAALHELRLLQPLSDGLSVHRRQPCRRRLARFNCVQNEETSTSIDNAVNIQSQIDEMLKKTQKTSVESVTVAAALENELFRNKVVAVGSSLVAIILLMYQKSLPVSSVGLLQAMENDSVDIATALCNGKPTVVDFYADWCENCKQMAPTMRSIEFEFANDVNFVTIDGANNKNADLVRRFHVDGIPHVALLKPNGEIQTSLIGAAPKKILLDDIKALINNKAMPYIGYDAFENESHFPFQDKQGGLCKADS